MRCIDKAEGELKSFLPKNEFEKKELGERHRGIFYRCMTNAGYEENKRWVYYWQKVAESPSNSRDRPVYEVLNEFRAQAMYEKEKQGNYEPYWTNTWREFLHVLEALIEHLQNR